jgi:hypothetical protein
MQLPGKEIQDILLNGDWHCLVPTSKQIRLQLPKQGVLNYKTQWKQEFQT